MSKLFDTLEKINHDDQDPTPEEPVVVQVSTKKNSRFFPFLVGLTIIVAILASVNLYTTMQKKKTSQPTFHLATKLPSMTAVTKQMRPAPARLSSPKGSNEDKMIFFNNQGVSLARQGKFWPAIYNFAQAEKLLPDRAEPVINMGLTLAHLGLQFPAQRYLQKAYTINPDNPHLRQAIAQAIANKQIAADSIPGTLAQEESN